MAHILVGLQVDFPENSGNCASCHLPTAAVNAPYDTDSNSVTGIGLEGVTCDFCHKVWDVKIDDETGLPGLNMPGILSISLLRPSGEHQLFIGPYVDVAPGEDTYSAMQNSSQFCAACHSGNFWNTRIYNSYGEWLNSSYSDQDSEEYKTCQDCHMPSLGMDHFARIENGGLIRDSDTIFSHKMLGASDKALLQNTADLDVTVKRDGT
jgi:nitrate/TMAO reductase-like tetraheme cytochrome c subunit